jgi:hypothetical protein
MTSIYEIRDVQEGPLTDGRFERRDEAIRAARDLDTQGYDCEVFAIDTSTGYATGCVYGRAPWGTWDE